MLVDCWIKIFFEEPGEIMANEEIKNEQTLEEKVEKTTREQKIDKKAKKEKRKKIRSRVFKTLLVVMILFLIKMK